MASMRMCDAMLPAVAQSLAADLQSTAGIVSSFAVAYGLSQLFYGVLGDRVGRAKIMSMALLGCTLATLLAAVSPSLSMLVTARALTGAAAGGIIPLAIATIADRVPFEHRQAVLAKLLSYTLLGLIGGSWAGGYIADTFSWRGAFWAMGGLFAIVGLGVNLKMPNGVAISPLNTDKLSTLANIRSLLTSRWSLTVLITTFLEGAIVFGMLAFVPSMLHLRFGTALSTAGLSVALFGVGGLLYTRLARYLLKTLRQPNLVALGSVLMALAFGILAVMPTASWSAPACFLAGLGFYMLHNTLQTCATQLNPTARGSAVSLFVFVFFLGQSTGVSLMSRATGVGEWVGAQGSAALLVLSIGVVFSLQMLRHLTKH